MINPTTKKGYSENNTAILFESMEAQGFDSEECAGYGQWLQAGRQVSKGQKGTQIIRIVEKKVKNKKTGKVEKKKVPVKHSVFFVEQTEIATPKKEEKAA